MDVDLTLIVVKVERLFPIDLRLKKSIILTIIKRKNDNGEVEKSNNKKNKIVEIKN